MKIRFGYTKYYPIQSPMGRMISGVFLVLGLLVCLYSVFLFWKHGQVKDQLVQVDAVIERIDIRGAGEDREHAVYVSYSYGGRTYDSIRLSWYSSDMEEGDRLVLTIHPDAPGEPVKNDGPTVLLIGGFFTLFGVVFSAASRWDDLKERFSAGAPEGAGAPGKHP